jgi:hypothetical protein
MVTITKEIGVGSYVVMQDIMEQSDYRWVTLSPLIFNEDGGVVGGQIYDFCEKYAEAEDKAYEIRQKGGRSIVIEGKREPGLVIREVFIDE